MKKILNNFKKYLFFYNRFNKSFYKIFFEGTTNIQSKIIYHIEKSKDNSLIQISLEKILIALIIVAIIIFFIHLFIYYSTPLDKISTYPNVKILNNQDIISKLKFGISPKCSNNIDCWLLKEIDDTNWVNVNIPNLILKKVEGYDKGLTTGTIYYRMHVTVPNHLLNIKDTISFSPGWINHKYFEVYINGRLVHLSDGINPSQTIVAIPLHKNDYGQNGKFLFAVKAKLTNADVGISHYGKIFIGPKKYIDQIFVNQERTTTTFQTLFLLSKGSIFIILALFYLYTSVQRGFLHFLIFAFLVMCEPIIIMSSEYLNLNIRVLLFYFVKSLAITFLLKFFMEFFDIKKSIVQFMNIISFVTILSVLLMSWDRTWGTRFISGVHIFHFTNTYLIFVILLAIIFGVASYIRLSQTSIIGHDVLLSIKGFIFFLSLYFVAIVITSYFLAFKGHDKRAILDLFFFFYVALINIRNFGLNEGKIASLEYHLLEQRKIELEFEEAAAMAQVFLPQDLPNWNFVNLAVHHKAISKVSGDWYTFEKSYNDKLYHFILADITGHGVQAAIVVSTCKSVLSSIHKLQPNILDQDDFLKQYAELLNYTLYLQGKGSHTTTLVGFTFKPDEQLLLYLSAAHPPALYIKDNNTKPSILTSKGTLVGFNPYSVYNVMQTSFNYDDELIAYTDGIPLLSYWNTINEVKNIQKNFYELPKSLYQKIWEKEYKHRHKEPNDDVSIIWFKFAS